MQDQWQEAPRNNTVSLSDQKKPIIGFYVGTKKEIIQDPEKGDRETKIHVFINDSGFVEFWGFLDFDLKIKNIIPGCLCKLEYGGTEKKGDKEYNIVKLLFNPNKKLDSIKLIEL